MSHIDQHMLRYGVAIVGMAGRFPGAKNLAEFWSNICAGKESVDFFDSDGNKTAQSHRSMGVLDDIDMFDPAYFGLSQKEARLMDPQQRLFMECVWESLNDAKYDPFNTGCVTGIYAGLGFNSYLFNVYSQLKPQDISSFYEMIFLNDKDYLPTRIANRFNFTGPAINVQTACSTSLVAVHLACQALLSGECSMAVAGGVSVIFPQNGFLASGRDDVHAGDGRCYPFDERANGMVIGNGCGCVVLRRLEDALKDSNKIYAVIRGSAINNDGSRKPGYTAPSIDGQSEVIRSALQISDVTPDSVSFIETHGTGTALGDPVEFEALRIAYNGIKSCALGTLKANIGHTFAAAGIASLIKTALSLYHRVIPPVINFTNPNKQIHLNDSPFHFNRSLTKWTNPLPRAGVSAFGIGGTNAHVILEGMQHSNQSELSVNSSPVVFLFPGAGLYANWGAELFNSNEVFRGHFNFCLSLLEDSLAQDLMDILLETKHEMPRRLMKSTYHLPLLFIIEYSLAKTLWDGGIVPQMMMGHSFGEYTAACISGVLSLEDALKLVCFRGKIFEKVQKGDLIMIFASADDVKKVLPEGLSIASINTKTFCTVSGSAHRLDALEFHLTKVGLSFKRLNMNYAAHCELIDPILGEFEKYFTSIKLNRPRIPYISNLTGDIIDADQVVEPHYWVRHVRETVQFASGTEKMISQGFVNYVEVGPGKSLSTIIQQGTTKSLKCLTLMDKDSDLNTFQKAIYALKSGSSLLSRKKHWIDLKNEPANDHPRVDEKTANIDDWFYVPIWKRAFELRHQELTTGDVWLVFEDLGGISRPVIKYLQDNGQVVVRIRRGDQFRKKSQDEFELNWDDEKNYSHVISEISQNFKVHHIISFWNLDPIPKNASYESFGFWHLIWLTRSLAQYHRSSIKILVVTDQMQNVLGNESVISEKSTLRAAILSIQREYPMIMCGNLDLNILDQFAGHFAQMLIDECLDSQEMFVAHRFGKRWIQKCESIKLSAKNVLKKDGVYLITGGLGGIGLTIAESIANKVSATLVLLSRRKFQDVKDSNILKQISYIQNRGCKVEIIQADVSRETDMIMVFERIQNSYGKISGVIHSAGIFNAGLISQMTENETDDIWKVKISGTKILGKLLLTHKPDFFLLCSGAITFSGGILGETAYVGGNCFLDSYAQKEYSDGKTYVMTANWDVWKDVGMTEAQNISDSAKTLKKKLDNVSITPKEGAYLFEKIISSRQPQVITFTRNPIFLNDPSLLNASNIDKFTFNRSISKAYALPTNGEELRHFLAKIWSEELGIDSIGIHDHFFELGGNSFVAVQIVSKVTNLLKTQFPLSALIENPTIDCMARVIESLKTDEKNDSRQIVRFSLKNSEKKPIFCIHPGGGTVFVYRRLAELIDAPLYGIQSVALVPGNDELGSIKLMAEHYFNLIKEIQSSGPYRIIGHSMGGTIAQELAVLIQEANDQVDLLCMIDAPCPMSISVSHLSRLEMFARVFGILSEIDLKAANNLDEKAQEHLIWDCLLKQNLVGASQNNFEMFFKLLRQHGDILLNHVPSVFRGNVIEFLSEEGDRNIWTREGWKKYVKGDIISSIITGNHQSIMESPNIEKIIKIIGERL